MPDNPLPKPSSPPQPRASQPQASQGKSNQGMVFNAGNQPTGSKPGNKTPAAGSLPKPKFGKGQQRAGGSKPGGRNQTQKPPPQAPAAQAAPKPTPSAPTPPKPAASAPVAKPPIPKAPTLGSQPVASPTAPQPPRSSQASPSPQAQASPQARQVPPMPRPLGAQPGSPLPPTPAAPQPAPPTAPQPTSQPVSPGAPQAAPVPAAPTAKTAGTQGQVVKQPQPAQPASAKKSPLSFITSLPRTTLLIIVGIMVILAAGVFAAMQFLGGDSDSTSVGTGGTGGQAGGRQTVPSKQVTLSYWGLWEPTAVFEEVLADFEEANPGIKVQYQKQNHQDYRERLQTAIASKNGPDIFRFHASWTPMMSEELAAIPNSIMSTDEYKNTFYPIATQQLQLNGQLVGIPLMYDGLALYYNKEILEAAGAAPPQTWAELKTLASRLTVRTPSGQDVERGGLAIGNTANVEHFSDIFGLLLLQNQADPALPTSKEAQEAFKFYTNFVLVDKVWSDKLPSSTIAFARGDVAMMFAPSWRAHEVQAMNPNLSFGVAPVPKLGSERISWATYWAEGVNSKGANKDEAWQLLKYLSTPEVLRKLYSAQSSQRRFGELYPRQEMASDLARDEMVAPFIEDAPYAKNWYLNSFTHDNGLNDQLIKYYQDAINAMLEGQEAEEVAPTVEQGATQVLRQYGVVSQ